MMLQVIYTVSICCYCW